MTEQFINDYNSLLFENDFTVAARMKEYLLSLDEAGKQRLRERFHVTKKSMAAIKDLELFKLMVDIFVQGGEITALLRALLETPDREEQYRALQTRVTELYGPASDYTPDFIGSDLKQLRLEALSFLARTGKHQCKVYMGHYESLEKVLIHGFLPSFRLYNKHSLKEPGNLEIILGHLDVPIPTLEYFYNRKLPKTFHMFVMVTEIGARRINGKNDTSTVMFRWTYPHLLYSSQRERTNMGMFRTPFSNTGSVINQTLKTDFGSYTPLDINFKLILEGKYYLPVTRYAFSVTSGFYHEEPKQKYCGTFYYYEGESSTLLLAETILVVETKCTATKYLLENFPVSAELRNQATTIISRYLDNNNEAWEENYYLKDLIYTPEELFAAGFVREVRGGHLARDVPQVSIYCGKLTSLYAEEDVFDQILCLLAKEVGVDLVVLTRMVGAKQIVTEVLDARSREDSFKNLVFT